jgi:tetratricopeptide (TPR) repeat protein
MKTEQIPGVINHIKEIAIMKRALLTLLVLVFPVLCSAKESVTIDWDKVPEDTRLALYECQQELNQNHYAIAIEILEKFQKKRPRDNHFLVEFNLGTAYALSGKIDEGIRHLEKAVEMEGRYEPLWMNLGKIYYQAKQFVKAGKAFETAFTYQITNDPETLFMAMAAYFQGNDMKKSIEIGEALISKHNSLTNDVVGMLVNAYLSTKNYTRPIEIVTTLNKKNPNSAENWKLLAQLYFNSNQYEQATIAYEVYGYLHGLDKEEMNLMGDLFAMVGAPQKAADYYTMAVKGAGSAEAYEKLSAVYYSAFDYKNAVRFLEQALQEQTTFERMQLKAQLYYLQERYREAKLSYAAAAPQTKDGQEWLMAGYCAMRDQDIANARLWLQKAMQYPEQAQEAQSLLKMVNPTEDIRKAMVEFKNAVQFPEIL